MRELRLQELKKQIALGLDDLAAGKFTEYDDASLKGRMEAIKNRSKKRSGSRRGKKGQ